MRAILYFIFLVVVAGCVSAANPFVQDDIKIVPPVKPQLDKQGKTDVWMYHDGGTKRIKITDAEGRTFDIYIDHRLFTKTPGEIYLLAYPSATNSVRVLDRKDFTQTIGPFE